MKSTGNVLTRDAGHRAGHEHEHEFEAAHGLPEPLPTGERVLWQGEPDWRMLARDALHTRTLSVYFAVLLVWRAGTVLSNGGTVRAAIESVLWLMPLAVLAIGVLTLMAWLMARTSVYTVTDRRVVMRIGVVLSITFNLPFSRIESAGLRARPDGSGDLALKLGERDQIAFVHLWPHARPWAVRRTQPMLRGLPQARKVAAVLAAALSESAGVPRAAAAGLAPPVAPVHASDERGQGRHPLAA